MIKGFFFDLDGTLVDTHRANFEAYRRAIKEVSGVEISFDDFRQTIGSVAKVFLPQFVPSIGEVEVRRITDLKAEYYKDLMHLTLLNDALVEFMHLMKDVQIVLVTTAKGRNANAVLKHHDIGDYFNFVITAEDVEKPKPNPEAYLLALEKTGLLPSEVLAFEDSEVGKQAAEAAGIPVAMINIFSL